MAGFSTHITVSTGLGVAYGVWGYDILHLPTSACLVAGGVCSIAGMMPDLDSDSGIPARETIGFAAAVVPMLLMSRLVAQGLNVEHMLLAGAPIYLLIRFGFGEILRRFTVHRGMFHSIPAMVITGMIVYLVSEPQYEATRVFKAAGAMLGFASHLVLDEIWSINFGAGEPRLKKSFGTALKFVGNDVGATCACYGLLLFLGMWVARDMPPSTLAAGEALIRRELDGGTSPANPAFSPPRNREPSTGGFRWDEARRVPPPSEIDRGAPTDDWDAAVSSPPINNRALPQQNRAVRQPAVRRTQPPAGDNGPARRDRNGRPVRQATAEPWYDPIDPFY